MRHRRDLVAGKRRSRRNSPVRRCEGGRHAAGAEGSLRAGWSAELLLIGRQRGEGVLDPREMLCGVAGVVACRLGEPGQGERASQPLESRRKMFAERKVVGAIT